MRKELKAAIKKHSLPIAYTAEEGRIKFFSFSGFDFEDSPWDESIKEEIRSYNNEGTEGLSTWSKVYLFDYLFRYFFFEYDFHNSVSEIEKSLKQYNIPFYEDKLAEVRQYLEKMPKVNFDLHNKTGLNFQGCWMKIKQMSRRYIICESIHKDEDGKGLLVLSYLNKKNEGIPFEIIATLGEEELYIFDSEYGDKINLRKIKRYLRLGYDVKLVLTGSYITKFNSTEKIGKSGIDERYDAYIKLFKLYFPAMEIENIFLKLKCDF